MLFVSPLKTEMRGTNLPYAQWQEQHKSAILLHWPTIPVELTEEGKEAKPVFAPAKSHNDLAVAALKRIT